MQNSIETSHNDQYIKEVRCVGELLQEVKRNTFSKAGVKPRSLMEAESVCA